MNWIIAAAVSAFLGVALGAFGAHGFKDRLGELGTAATWDTAVLYHLVHALALFGCGLLLRGPAEAPGPLRAAPWCFLAGMAVFSGSLYILSLTGVKALGAVTPIGGVLLLAGWVALAFGARTGTP